VTQTDRVTSRIALALALMGLVVSLGGVSYAAVKINGNQIQKGTITAKQVKDGGLLAADFKAGELPSGPQGVQGPPGATGPAGPGAVLVDLTTSATTTETEVADGLSVSWECNPGIDAILQMTSPSGLPEWTGTVWEDGAVHGQSVGQPGLVLGDLASTASYGFTGTVRNPVTGAVVWIDALFTMDGSACLGRVVATPLT
jgi:hypothetical protein